MPDLLVTVRLDVLAARLTAALGEPCTRFNAASWLALRHQREVSQRGSLDVFKFRCDPTLILFKSEIKVILPVNGGKSDAD